MMLMFPVSSSITCTCPGDLPGKASIFCPKQAKPRGLSEVSKTDSFFGGDEKANTWMLFSNATMIRDLDRRTPRTEVRNSSVMAAFCFASSQMTNYVIPICQIISSNVQQQGHTLFCGNLGLRPPPTIAR